MTQAVDSAAPSGRICLVGNPASDMVLGKDVYWKILRNQLTVRGTWNSSFTRHQADDWHYALELLSQERIDISRLISHSIHISKIHIAVKVGIPDILPLKTGNILRRHALKWVYQITGSPH